MTHTIDEVWTIVSGIQTQLAGITSLANWLRTMMLSNSPHTSTLAEINASFDGETGQYDNTTDSMGGFGSTLYNAQQDINSLSNAIGTDGLMLISADPQDLSGSLSVNAGKLNGMTPLNNTTIVLQTAVVGSTISVYNAVDIDFTLSGLTDFTGWTKLWFTAKNSVRDTDTQALLQLLVSSTPNAATDGLLVLQGASQTKTNGTITVTGTTQIRVQVAAAAGVNLVPTLNAGVWDVKVLKSGKVTPTTEGGLFAITGVATKAIA